MKRSWRRLKCGASWSPSPQSVDLVVEELLNDAEVPRGGDGQELGDVLDDVEDDGVQPVHGSPRGACGGGEREATRCRPGHALSVRVEPASRRLAGDPRGSPCARRPPSVGLGGQALQDDVVQEPIHSPGTAEGIGRTPMIDLVIWILLIACLVIGDLRWL